jgi:hypothetical protein
MALLLAATDGHVAALQLLLSHPGVEVNSASAHGWMALTLARHRIRFD